MPESYMPLDQRVAALANEIYYLKKAIDELCNHIHDPVTGTPCVRMGTWSSYGDALLPLGTRISDITPHQKIGQSIQGT